MTHDSTPFFQMTIPFPIHLVCESDDGYSHSMYQYYFFFLFFFFSSGGLWGIIFFSIYIVYTIHS